MSTYTILDLLKKGLSKNQICKEMEIQESKFDSVIERAFHLLQVEEELNEPEFNLKTHMFSDKGFENNIDFLCARIENDPEFSTKEILSLGEQCIETNYDLVIANHPLQERLAKYFTVPVKFPIIILSGQNLAIHEKLKNQ